MLFPVMPDIEISVNGAAKLLSNLNFAKAAGPDGIRLIVLKELSHVIAPILTAVFQKSLDKVKFLQTGRKPKFALSSKKITNKTLLSTALYLLLVFCARLWSTLLLLVSQNSSTRTVSYMTFNTAFVTKGHVKLSFYN